MSNAARFVGNAGGFCCLVINHLHRVSGRGGVAIHQTLAARGVFQTTHFADGTGSDDFRLREFHQLHGHGEGFATKISVQSGNQDDAVFEQQVQQQGNDGGREKVELVNPDNHRITDRGADGTDVVLVDAYRLMTLTVTRGNRVGSRVFLRLNADRADLPDAELFESADELFAFAAEHRAGKERD